MGSLQRLLADYTTENEEITVKNAQITLEKEQFQAENREITEVMRGLEQQKNLLAASTGDGVKDLEQRLAQLQVSVYMYVCACICIYM